MTARRAHSLCALANGLLIGAICFILAFVAFVFALNHSELDAYDGLALILLVGAIAVPLICGLALASLVIAIVGLFGRWSIVLLCGHALLTSGIALAFTLADWLPAVLGLCSAVLSILFSLRASPPKPGPHHCGHCDYDLAGLIAPSCPECGHPHA